MSELLSQGLLMTAIGMGLVFLALIFLWGLINLIASLPIKGRKEEEEEILAEGPEVVTTAEPPADERQALRARAAAAAVAAALAVQRSALRIAPPAGGAISAWQAARRGNQFALNAQITSRKTRSSVR
ncbi:OadG family protein [Bellilinea sp.]|jgi:Na+-transporting methylmalonyl-CoA/oxaloacetate decarboxylase gamma subunit|uniref:OadG family protein n=1 Tax=Bellilinea sp. TaxID=2838785 RepID=UPI002ADE8DDF|nr:OadG family protein [Bellilinea sp.]